MEVRGLLSVFGHGGRAGGLHLGTNMSYASVPEDGSVAVGRIGAVANSTDTQGNLAYLFRSFDSRDDVRRLDPRDDLFFQNSVFSTPEELYALLAQIPDGSDRARPLNGRYRHYRAAPPWQGLRPGCAGQHARQGGGLDC